MSSKRGRKRNDNLPPNRARDVQRAFRARRAAHLQALEQRVTELEDENYCLRQALNLPAANRLPLGRGPTGKDKPKQPSPSFTLEAFNMPLSSRDSSSSPLSTRLGSQSPPNGLGNNVGAVGVAAPVDESVWEQTIIMSDSEMGNDVPSSSASSSYPLPPMSAPPMLSTTKSMQYSHPYTSSIPSSTSSSLPPVRSLSNPMFMSSQSHYSHSTDRPGTSSYESPSFSLRTEVRDIQDEPPRSYTYPHSPYQSHESAHHTPSALHSHSQTHTPDPTLPYLNRRSLTEPQLFTINQGFPHLPNPLAHQTIRLPSPPRFQDSKHDLHLSLREHGHELNPVS